MKLKDFIAPLFKWWWLIILSTIIAGGISYIVTRPMALIYQSSAMLLVGHSLDERNPSGSDLALSRQLAQAYTMLVWHQELQQAALDELNKIYPDVHALPNYNATNPVEGPFIQIDVLDTNPKRAQDAANILAEQLIKQSPASDQDQMAFIQSEMNAAQEGIGKANEEIRIKQDELGKLTSAVQIANAQSDLLAVQNKLASLQSYYSSLLNNRRPVNTLSFFNKATFSSEPVSPNKKLIILVATAAGLILSTGMVYLMEFWDRSIKTEEDARRIFEAPVLGFIARIPKTSPNPYTYTVEQPRSPISDAFRSLRANLDFVSIDEPIRTVLITSVDMADGKTTISTNLALSLSQVEKKVVLVDGDLRQSNIYSALEIEEHPGLCDALRDRLAASEVVQTYKNTPLKVISAGSPPPNPTELLASKRLTQMLEDLKLEHDIILVDGSPYLVADSTVLGSKVDGVILIVRPGRTREDAARAVRDQMRRSGARLIGVVFNRVSGKGLQYRYGQYNYSPPEKPTEQNAQSDPKEATDV